MAIPFQVSIRPLGNENDKAFALINALNDAQRKQAILAYRVSDLVLGPGQDGRTIQPEGIPASALTPPQQTMLLDLVREWTTAMPNARLLPVPGAAHFAYAERPEVVWPEVERFLEGR